MSKGLGIAAIICVVLAIFVPIYGSHLTVLAAVLASAAAYFGEKPLAIATAVVGFVNVFFLTPSLGLFDGSTRAIIYIVSLVPLGAVLLRHLISQPVPTAEIDASRK
jgi:hypothetical protein